MEIAKTFGDPDLPRPWSKYSRGSSAFEKRQTARNVEEKVDKKENAHKHHVSADVCLLVNRYLTLCVL